MVITFQGLESLRIQFGDTTVAYNPVSKESKYKSISFGSDIVLVSTRHPDFNGIEQASRGEKAPFVIDGPGEYEIKGVFIKGFVSKSNYGLPAEASGKEKVNTIYLMTLEGMNLCFLGPIGSADAVTVETKEELPDIDILFVPIGGGDVLEPAAAYKLAVKLEPKIIVPMHYDSENGGRVLKTFLREGGEEKTESIDKLTLKRKDLEGKEGDIIVLAPAN